MGIFVTCASQLRSLLKKVTGTVRGRTFPSISPARDRGQRPCTEGQAGKLRSHVQQVNLMSPDITITPKRPALSPSWGGPDLTSSGAAGCIPPMQCPAFDRRHLSPGFLADLRIPPARPCGPCARVHRAGPLCLGGSRVDNPSGKMRIAAASSAGERAVPAIHREAAGCLSLSLLRAPLAPQASTSYTGYGHALCSPAPGVCSVIAKSGDGGVAWNGSCIVCSS